MANGDGNRDTLGRLLRQIGRVGRQIGRMRKRVGEKWAFREWKMRAKRANCDKFGKRFGAKVLKLLSFSKISLRRYH